MDDICSKTGSGSTPRGGKSVYQRDGVPFLRSQNVHNGGLRLDDVAYIAPQTHEKMSGTAVEPGDLLLNITGGSIGRCCLVANGFGEANVSQHVAIIRVAIDGIQCYLHQLVLSPYFQSFVFSEQTGAGRGGLPKNRMDRIPVALPPIAEQHRIVAKVNELMAVCDRLERARAERESRRHRLAATSLYHLTNGADAEASNKHARFCLSHLPEIARGPEDIPALRQAILNLAVQGKLVQQNPEDGSPESLLSKVREIRKNSVNRSKKSSVNDSDPKFVQHLPMNLPHGWGACPLEELFNFIDYRGRTPTRTARGVRLITAKNVRMGYVANDPVEFIDERAYKAWMTRGFPRNGDLLFVTEGATMGFVGTIELQFEFALAQRTIDLQPYLPSYSRFFFFTLMSPIFQEAVLTNSTGTAVKGIKAAKLKRIRVPLPPLAEQQRIVAKVEELMVLCDRLETQLTGARTETSRLLEAVLHHAFFDTIESASRTNPPGPTNLDLLSSTISANQ